MTTVSESGQTQRPSSRQTLIRLAKAIDTQAGIVDDPTVTHETLRSKLLELMKEKGIKPEDNIGSRELMRMRYGDEEHEE